jgi:hypothetical protein
MMTQSVMMTGVTTFVLMYAKTIEKAAPACQENLPIVPAWADKLPSCLSQIK